MTCRSANSHRLCTSDIVPMDPQISRGHLAGSSILPRSISTWTVCEQVRQRKKATFMSGITGVARMTSPLMATSLSVSEMRYVSPHPVTLTRRDIPVGFNSLMFTVVSPNGLTL